MNEYLYAAAAFGIMAALVIAALIRQKRGQKEHPCDGCPNYSTCRAHIGCGNNPNRKKK